MAYSIVMPRLGWTMEEGVFGAWLKADGERVSPGDLLFTVEGDKAIQEVETFESGILRIPPGAPQPGDVVVVGAVLGYLMQEGEDLPFAALSNPVAAAPQEAGSAMRTAAAVPAVIPAAAAANGSGALPAISPRARRVAGELGIDWTQVQGSGRTGRIVERDVRAAAQAAAAAAQAELRSAPPVRATPVAQRVAQDAGINLSAVSPTGPGGAHPAQRRGSGHPGAAGACRTCP